MDWQPIETAPRPHPETGEGAQYILGYADGEMHVCYPKRFPRPLHPRTDMTVSMAGDRWEYFRDDEVIPGHSWSMTPTHWMPLPDPPVRP